MRRNFRVKRMPYIKYVKYRMYYTRKTNAVSLMSIQILIKTLKNVFITQKICHVHNTVRNT